MKNYILLFISVFMLTITACREDAVIGTMTTEIIDEVMYSGNVIGTVVGVTGQPIENATVTIGGQTTTTKYDGAFIIKDVDLTSFGKYVSVSKAGFFHGGKNIFANDSGDYSTRITLIPYATRTEFAATAGVSFDVGEATVEIPSNGVSLNGTPYNGTVELNAQWLDPTDPETFTIMPGNLTALNADNELQALLSFGMIGVDMFTPSGDKLQLRENAEATLNFPVPQSLLSQAEPTIDLWHFDESSGKWLLEGQADLVNGAYEARVSHFSWWNCDVAANTTTLCVNFVDRFGNPVVIQNAEFVLTSENSGVASAFINSSSYYCNIVPQGQTFVMQLLTSCGDIIVEQTIGPFDESEVELTIQINEELPFNVLNFSGTISDCDGNPVSNGFIQLISDENEAFALSAGDGTYDLNIIDCGNTTNVTVYGVDIDNLLEETVDVPIIAGTNEYEVDITACDGVTVGTSFIQYFSMNGTISSDVCDARVTAAETLIISEEILLGINGFGTGNFTGNLITSGVSNNNLDETTIEITAFGEVGENIVGTFTNPAGNGTFVATRVQ